MGKKSLKLAPKLMDRVATRTISQRKLGEHDYNAEDAIADRRLNLKELGERWKCHHKTAQRRAARLGIKPIRLTRRSLLYKLSDVLKVEELCS